jgi:hypothetical protein
MWPNALDHGCEKAPFPTGFNVMFPVNDVSVPNDKMKRYTNLNQN